MQLRRQEVINIKGEKDTSFFIDKINCTTLFFENNIYDYGFYVGY